MGRREIEKHEVRKIQQSKGTYFVSLPIELVRKFKWREGQQVTVEEYGKHKLIIRDWE